MICIRNAFAFRIVRDFASLVALGREFDAGQLYRDTIERHFLFEKDVCNYIDQMYNKATQLAQLDIRLSQLGMNDQAQAQHAEVTQIKTWFFNQSDDMFRAFPKDLSIKTLR